MRATGRTNLCGINAAVDVVVLKISPRVPHNLQLYFPSVKKYFQQVFFDILRQLGPLPKEQFEITTLYLQIYGYKTKIKEN